MGRDRNLFLKQRFQKAAFQQRLYTPPALRAASVNGCYVTRIRNQLSEDHAALPHKHATDRLGTIP
jgi:hypothetical protein